MLGKFLVAKVAVNKTAFSFDTEYSYAIPSDLSQKAEIGRRVVIPFGKGNRRRIGFITRLYERDTYDEAVKPIHSVIDDIPLINDDLLKITYWLKENTFCTLFEGYKTIVPTGFSYNISRKYELVNAEVDMPLSKEENNLFTALKIAKTKREFDELLVVSDEDPSKRKVIDSLLDKGVLEDVEVVKRKVGDELVKMISLSSEYLSGEIKADITPKQKMVVNLLSECKSASSKEICYLLNVTETIIKRLLEKGVLISYFDETYRAADSSVYEQKNLDNIELSDKQEVIYNGIKELVDEEKPVGALLRGITGSGKTSIYLKLIEHTLKSNKSAIMLVPEISLTPQMVSQFKSYFGEIVAVYHSNLSLGQRMDEYKRIKRGEARIVIGTRSAVFAPCVNLGLIIIDEEGEHTYKSESSPRYHAREVAIQRCGNNNSTLLMGSATPSLSTYYYAKSGRFKLFELDERFSVSELPQVEIIDMVDEQIANNYSLFSKKLVNAINERISQGEQCILLLNRRGFNTYITCLDCKTAIECPNCNIPLTYHKINDRLMCHYCGFSMSAKDSCPNCSSNHLKATGVGTQRVEEELERLFPTAKVLRMDADTTYSKFAYQNNFGDFKNHKYDIMIGTQMIAKGLDFPNVTLVGVLSLDNALFAGNYDSYERTFSLVTQVVGRSGRGEKKGVAYIQTFVPEHPVLRFAAKQNYLGFYEDEIALRKALVYPPFCDICVIGITSPLEKLAITASNVFNYILSKKIKELNYKSPLRVIGPAPFTLGKINNRFRYRTIIKFKNSSASRELIRSALVEAMKNKSFSNVRIYADINGEI